MAPGEVIKSAADEKAETSRTLAEQLAALDGSYHKTKKVRTLRAAAVVSPFKSVSSRREMSIA